MDTPEVFFIGDVALDEYYETDLFPKIKDKVLVHTLPAQMGGTIANACCVFNSYGVRPHFITALNSGDISGRLCRGLEAQGIDTRYVVTDDSLPDSKTIVILAENEHTVFIPTMGIHQTELSDDAYAALCGSDYIYSAFCELRPLRYRGMDSCTILKNIVAGGGKIWCDLDVCDIFDSDSVFFDYVDTVFVNEVGFRKLERISGGDPAGWLFAKNAKTFVVTLAENGCKVWQKGEPALEIPGHKVPVADVTGAGDTFCASFMYAYIKTHDTALCAEFANLAAARAVTIMGPRAGAVGAETVIDFARKMGIKTKKFCALI
jgi:sugar/nucleoside kinase (ribokinase family)